MDGRIMYDGRVPTGTESGGPGVASRPVAKHLDQSLAIRAFVRRLVVEVALDPGRAFHWMRGRDLLAAAWWLMALRWFSTTAVTIVSMYLNQSPMLLPAPFGIAPDTYRFIEIFLYAPYGLLLMAATAWSLCFFARVGYGHTWSFRQMFPLLSVSFFLPWLPSLLFDPLIIWTQGGGPEIIVPYHLAIVAWESVLVAVGVNRIFSLPPSRALFFGFLAGALFLAFGGLFIR